MKLQEYLDLNKMSVTDFNRKSKISRATIYKFLAGRGGNRKSTHWIIEKATEGKVTSQDLIMEKHG